jgi:hypothetical protein
LTVQVKEGADLEEACGDIERNGQVGPLFQVVPDPFSPLSLIHRFESEKLEVGRERGENYCSIEKRSTDIWLTT